LGKHVATAYVENKKKKKKKTEGGRWMTEGGEGE
jgi:hypothetical protein